MFCDEALDAVEAIAAGDLTPDGRVAEHLTTCPNCAAALVSARALERMLRVRSIPKPPAQFTTRTLARVRRARWRSEQFLDVGFNVAIGRRRPHRHRRRLDSAEPRRASSRSATTWWISSAAAWWRSRDESVRRCRSTRGDRAPRHRARHLVVGRARRELLIHELRPTPDRRPDRCRVESARRLLSAAARLVAAIPATRSRTVRSFSPGDS